MADWGRVGNQLTQGFQIGAATGGKLSGLGMVLNKVADRLRTQRETGEQLNLLGRTQQIKNLYPSEVEKAQAEYYRAKSAEALRPSYTEQFRMDLQNAGAKIQSGENVETITNEMMRKYPGSMTADIIYNLKEVGKNIPKRIVPTYKPAEVQEWSNVPVGRRILSAITPSATPEEQRLGGLRIGGIFKAPPIGIRKQAMDALKSVGYPITEANIKAAMEQLGK